MAVHGQSLCLLVQHWGELCGKCWLVALTLTLFKVWSHILPSSLPLQFVFFFPFLSLAFLLSLPLYFSSYTTCASPHHLTQLFVSVSLFSPTKLPLLLFPGLATVPLHLFHPILPRHSFTLSILTCVLCSCRLELCCRSKDIMER